MSEEHGNPEPGHTAGVRQGNEVASDDEEGKEPGRHDEGSSGADRPAGSSTSRDSTSVNPKDPIDPAMPNFPSN